MTRNRRVTISINNDIDLDFRKIASNKMLFKTGWYSKAIEEAIREDETLVNERDFIEEIMGITKQKNPVIC